VRRDDLRRRREGAHPRLSTKKVSQAGLPTFAKDRKEKGTVSGLETAALPPGSF